MQTEQLAELNRRLSSIEAYIQEGKLSRIQINETLKTLNLRLIYLEEETDGKGDKKGFRGRIENLEEEKKERKEIKDGFLKIAVGSMTLAIGSFVLWLGKLIWEHLGK